MKSIFEKMGLVEGDNAAPDVEAPVPHVAAPQPPAPVYAYTPSAPTTATLSAEDQASLKALEAQVYAIPSTFMAFKRVRETLGNSTDIKTVFNVLAAANPGVTAEKVIADINAHLGIIAQKKTEFDNQIAQARTQRIDGPTAQIADLTKQNADAQAAIGERTAQITKLAASLTTAQQALTDGTARFKLIEDQLSAPLIQVKQLLGQG